jgi:hypothetical protein
MSCKEGLQSAIFACDTRGWCGCAGEQSRDDHRFHTQSYHRNAAVPIVPLSPTPTVVDDTGPLPAAVGCQVEGTTSEPVLP